MTKPEALEWLREWREMALSERARDMFVVVAREVSPWTVRDE